MSVQNIIECVVIYGPEQLSIKMHLQSRRRFIIVLSGYDFKSSAEHEVSLNLSVYLLSHFDAYQL